MSKEMKMKLPPNENYFLFEDDEENKILVKGEGNKSELVDAFLDEYRKLLDESYEPDWNLDFYDELGDRLEGRMTIQILDYYKL
jgi:hypothetical protein